MLAKLLCCLYVQLGTAFMAGNPLPPPGVAFWEYDINDVVNPYGTAEIGIDYPVSQKFEFEAALRHISSLPAKDFGVNSAEIRIRWYPFRTER